MDRTLASAVLAVALHVAVFLAVPLPHRSLPLGAPAAAGTEIDLDTAPAASLGAVFEPTAELERTNSPSLTKEHVSASARRASSAEGREAPSASPLASSSTPADSASATEPSSEGTWTFSPLQSSGEGPLPDRGLAAAVSAGVRATVSEESKERDKNPLKRTISPYSPRDIDLGLFPGSALVGLAHDAVRRSRAPDVGRALLEFELDGAGLVAKVRVLDASSARAEWDEVAEELARDARALPPQRMPTGSKGVAVTIELTSAIKSVSGSTPTKNPVTKVLRAIDDPIDSLIDGKTPPQRVVAARVVRVDAL
jgi:TonB family protein